MRSERIASAVGLPRRDVAPSTRIELAYRGRQPRILTRGLREQVSELRESNPRLRFVGPRPSHWTSSGTGGGCWPHGTALMRRSCALAPPALHPREESNLLIRRS